MFDQFAPDLRPKESAPRRVPVDQGARGNAQHIHSLLTLLFIGAPLRAGGQRGILRPFSGYPGFSG
jgi:hypothetical protein